MADIVYDALNSGGYFADGVSGMVVLAAAALGVLVGLALVVAGLRRASSRGMFVALGSIVAVAGAAGVAATEYAPVRDSRDIAGGRYTVMTGTVLVVSPQAISVDKVQFATPCRAEAAQRCATATSGDLVRVAYRGLDLTEYGPRALRIWRLPKPPPEPVAEQPSETSVYAPPDVARPAQVSPTTRSSGGLTIRLIPGPLGQ